MLLTDLRAACLDGGIRVAWTVAGDIEFLGFLVLRAPEGGDAETFEPLNADQPVPGHGPWEYVDRTVVPGEAYDYEILGLLPGEDPMSFGPVHAVAMLRSATALRTDPDPATGPVTLRFELGKEARVSLRIFDARGARIRTLQDGLMPGGTNAVTWDRRDGFGRRVPGGIYYARLSRNGRIQTARIVLLN